MEQRQDTHKSRTKIIRKGVGILFIFTQNSLVRLKLIMNRKSPALRIFIYLLNILYKITTLHYVDLLILDDQLEHLSLFLSNKNLELIRC